MASQLLEVTTFLINELSTLFIDAGFLASLVAEHRIHEDEALELAHGLTYGLVKRAYKL